MRVILIGLISLMLGYVSVAQNTRYFSIETKLMKLGELIVTQDIDPRTHEEQYKLETHFGLWSIYNIDYLLESKFNGTEMTYSLASIKVNGEYRHFCKVTRKNGVNRIERLNCKDTVTHQIINSAITQLYFNDFSGNDLVFSEYSGINKPFLKKNETTYILNDESKMEFIFSNGKISKVLVPNPVLDFYIVEKKHVAQN